MLAELGQRIINAEIESLSSIELTEDGFGVAVHLLIGVEGNVIVTGIGKSGLVARRIAATLTTCGIPAWYLSIDDALHGELGKVDSTEYKDLLIAVSCSGETDELVHFVSLAKDRHVQVIAITANPQSRLANLADCVIMHPADEACGLNLAPTSTATAAAVIGDALAVSTQEMLGFSEEDFANAHPNGALGKRLHCKVEELMVTGKDIGIIAPGESLLTAMIRLAEKRGTLVVRDDDTRSCLGVITAGDIARYVERRGMGWEGEPVTSVMTSEAHYTSVGVLVHDVLNEMQNSGIMAMPVMGEEFEGLVGMIHLHDILRAGVR